MNPSRLLLRQLRRHWHISDAHALADVLQLSQAHHQHADLPPALQQVLAHLTPFLEQVDATYAQHERDLALSQRSLDISSEELTAANQKLWAERQQMTRSAASLRETLGHLLLPQQPANTAPTRPALPEDLESIASQVAALVRAHEESRQMLHASEERLALAIQGSSIGLWDWNLQTDHVHFSDEWAALLGYHSHELAHEAATLINLLHGDDARAFGNAVSTYFNSQSTDIFRAEARLRCKNGQFKWMEFKGRVMQTADDGSPLRATGVTLDISARKSWEDALAQARDAAEAASRAKGDFLAHMSHEIRTPMNGILGLTELCLATQLDAEQRNYLEMVHASARSLLGVINDVLDFSKIEANRLDIEQIRFHLPQVLRHALAPVVPRAQGQGLQLITDIAPDVAEWFIGDPGRLRQIILNLVGNAVKFTETGEVRVKVEHLSSTSATSTDTARTHHLRFAVEDTGMGIPEEQLAHIFEAFSQADTSISRRFGGTGLGLTISARLVGLMGGQLQVESHPGKGTRFWFEISLPETSAPEAETSKTKFDIPTGLRVLVAEDHPINQVVARKVLEYLGQHVTMADNGLQAVQAVVQASQPFDVIFMDIQMPELDGFGATRRIRLHEQQTGGKRTPIIAMTAHAIEGYRERCVAGGMDGYVTKPMDRKHLLQEMQRLLRWN
jgi:PAS domain S-box-containing protein